MVPGEQLTDDMISARNLLVFVPFNMDDNVLFVIKILLGCLVVVLTGVIIGIVAQRRKKSVTVVF